MEGGGGREERKLPSLPSPSPFIPFLLSFQFSRRTRAEPLATQAIVVVAFVLFLT